MIYSGTKIRNPQDVFQVSYNVRGEEWSKEEDIFPTMLKKMSTDTESNL